MAFPTPFDFMTSVAILLVGVPIIYLLSKALKLRPKSIAIANPKKEATMAFLVAVVVFGTISAWSVVIIAFQIEALPMDFVDILWIILISATVLLPVMLAMKGTGQDLSSIGVNGSNLWRKLTPSLTVSIIFVVILGFLATSMGGDFAGFTPSLAYGFAYVAIISTTEELVWRGYIQTRFIAYGGTIKGYIGTSLIEIAFWHFPGRYVGYAGNASEAMASTLLILPVILLFGYIMLKSQNISSSSLFRFVYNFSLAILWQMSSI